MAAPIRFITMATIVLVLFLALGVFISMGGASEENHNFSIAVDGSSSPYGCLPRRHATRRPQEHNPRHSKLRAQLLEQSSASDDSTKKSSRPPSTFRVALKHRDYLLNKQFRHKQHDAAAELSRIKSWMHRDAARFSQIGSTIFARRAARVLQQQNGEGAGTSAGAGAGTGQIRRFHYDPTPPLPAESESFQGSVGSGLSMGSGEYFLELGIGTPSRPTALIVDTGSDLNWLQCEPCRVCYEQVGPVFNPANSSSYEPVSCHAPECGYVDPPSGSTCPANRNSSCRFIYSYGDQSNTTGVLAYETFTLTDASDGSSSGSGGGDGDGGSTTVDQISPVLFGCGHRNEGLFRGAAGVLGLGQGQLSWASQVGSLYGNRFSYCLVPRGSSLLVTSSMVFGHDSRLDDKELQWTPLLSLPSTGTYYYVQVVGVRVGDRQLPVAQSVWDLSPDGEGGTIVDSGTTLTYLPEPVVALLRLELRRQMRFPVVESPDQVLNFCFNVSGHEDWASGLPRLSFIFAGDAVMRLPVENFVVENEEHRGVACLAVQPGSSRNSLSILGNTMQQNFHVVFDRENYRLGFAPADCLSA